MRDLITHHVGGHLKVAPEHLDDDVLHLMKKPGLKNFDEFVNYFQEISSEIKKEQYVVPYFISGFPGTTHEQMEKVYDYLQEKGWNLQQVQAFIPTPMTLATAMYWTGIDPMSKKALFVAKEWKDRKLQQALLQPHKPEHREMVRQYHRRTGDPAARTGTAQATLPGTGAPRVGAKIRRPFKGRTVVDVPRGKMGRKLLLDDR